MRARLRTLLIVSGVAVAVVTAGTWALLNTGDAGRAAASPVPPPATRDGAPPPRRPAAEPVEESSGETASEPARPSYRVVGGGNCQASYYWEPQDTASGERFDPDALTAAHKTLPMHSKVRVTNRRNGRSVVVRINDRGPYVGGRCLDLSKAAMTSVGGTGSGVIPVEYEVLVRT
ncbi:septal ring lytic transglycosylase RlpA family protein [Thermomonospora umbrina]|uniref:Probable endolytic peptidoglycan transglycosylase RlpA n=1 Tax=Thermomonospora umbrina TaxID=111806 RepID=A0A3D9SNM9_9ACTN|nr:septal ring lytic transglycosylase RlpA family protein [Thermomonospora umbrina]REE97562.1 rare lipoprotein A [Thermomonospora umbrina]